MKCKQDPVSLLGGGDTKCWVQVQDTPGCSMLAIALFPVPVRSCSGSALARNPFTLGL